MKFGVVLVGLFIILLIGIGISIPFRQKGTTKYLVNKYIHPITITSTASQNNGEIPPKYTCDGENHNPPLTFSQVPRTAESLVLLVEDPNTPRETFTHWVLYNMPPSTLQILENEVPPQTKQGINSARKAEYMGPCPPSGTHHYIFTLYALDQTLNLPEMITKEEVVSVTRTYY